MPFIIIFRHTLAYLFTYFTVSSRFDRVEKLYIMHWCFTALLSIPSVQADGVLRFGRINPSGSEPKDILCIAHPIMSPVLFHSSKGKRFIMSWLPAVENDVCSWLLLQGVCFWNS